MEAAIGQIITRSGVNAKNAWTGPEAREVAACVALLGLVCADQERRLRAVEKCPISQTPHLFDGSKACVRCGTKAEP
jgi:hypothetical protein